VRRFGGVAGAVTCSAKAWMNACWTAGVASPLH